MTTPKHTPGPWAHFRLPEQTAAEQLAYVKWCIDKGEGEYHIVMCEKDDGPADVCHTGNGPTSAWNAALIAAAPDLLAALTEALRDCGCDGELCMHQWHDMARAAIAKAEGRKP